MKIYIGVDTSNKGQLLAYQICKRSIEKYSNIEIVPLLKKELQEKNLFYRKDNDGSTEFTYTRFLVPYLNNYKDYAIFCDSDFIWNCDPIELLEFINNKVSISCVHHKYYNCNSTTKMDGIKQEYYPRKNWSSLMIFNCEKCKILDINNVNNQSGKWLHRFEWLNDEQIGSIPYSYNYLVNYYHDIELPKAIHYTDGGPWYYSTRNCEFSKLWLSYLTNEEKTNLKDYQSDIFYEKISKNRYYIIGINVLESLDNTKKIIEKIINICNELNIKFIFKASFDKANRTSLNSYRGISIEKGIEIFRYIKENYNIPILTDIHDPYQAELLKDVVDIIQIPAFLCRQTDLLISAAKTNRIIHIKKGQFCSYEVLIKAAEKIKNFNNNKIILCERGTMFGYHDLIVDFRNISNMKKSNNLVSLDITHCLQKPAMTSQDGTVKSGGQREFIELMGKLGLVAGVNLLFMEVHEDPDNALCDGPTQYPIHKLKNLLQIFEKY